MVKSIFDFGRRSPFFNLMEKNVNRTRYHFAVAFLSLILISLAPATLIPVDSASAIRSAMSLARPGDTLVMLNGEWVDQAITFIGHGTESDPIVLRAETLGQVILTGASSLRVQGEWLVVDGLVFNEGRPHSGDVIEFRSGDPAHHCRLTNTVIRNYNPPDNGTEYKWVSLYGQHNRVDHCYFAGKTHAGATLVVWMDEEPDFHRIDHNWFGWRPDLGENGGETMRIGSSGWSLYDANCTVEDNLFQECNGEIEIISNKSCGNLYRRNTFRACDGTLTLRHGNRCSVYQNFFLGDKVRGSGGIRVIGEDHRIYNNYFENLQGDDYRSAICLVNGVPDSPLNRYFQVKGALIAHNTIVNCKRSFTIGAGAGDEQSLAPLDCVIADNAVYSNHASHRLMEYHDDPNNLIYQGNIMYGADLGIELPDRGILWQDPGMMSTDTLWRPVTDFPRPGMHSPLLDAAQSHFDFITEDMDGQTRIGLFDVGADEYSDEPTTNHPLTPDDVGPVDSRPRRRPSR